MPVVPATHRHQIAPGSPRNGGSIEEEIGLGSQYSWVAECRLAPQPAVHCCANAGQTGVSTQPRPAPPRPAKVLTALVPNSPTSSGVGYLKSELSCFQPEACNQGTREATGYHLVPGPRVTSSGGSLSHP